MATITIVASTGVGRIDLRQSNGRTATIYEQESYEFTYLAPSGYIEITNADGLPNYGGPYYANGVNIGGGEATYYISGGDQTIYVRATYYPPGYTLTYWGNGADGGWTDSQSGDTSYTVRDCGFYRDGYDFEYWYTYNGDIYYPGDTIYLSANTTLYASWIEFHTVTYNTNGGSGGPANGKKYKGKTYTIPSATPTKNGYDFVCWTDNFGAETRWYPGDSYDYEANVTFTAFWRIRSFTLTYNGNGATGGSTASQSGSTQYTVRDNGFSRTGHTFLYWSDPKGNVYSPGNTITLSSDTELKAQWKPNEYTISYNANRGTGAPGSQKKIYGIALTLSSTKPTRDGYIFLGWGLSSSTTTVNYQPGGSYTDNVSRMLYAVWAERAYFYWHGVSDDNDATYFAAGKRIDLAVTAEAWNRLCAYINEVRGYAGLSAVSFATVSAGDAFSANKFNIVSNAIKQIVNKGCGSHVPSIVTNGQEVTTALFNGPDGLKAAINSCMSEL